ncbi:MAG: sugar kinase, partial [Mucilaginibacter sp.]|nr:sugar kinase [Mucilaginibacter sp.]
NFNNMKNAIIYGSALASFCVEKFGTEKIKNLTEKEITTRIQEFVSLAAFEIA